MPCEVLWLVENRVIYTRTYGVVSIGEIQQLMAQTKDMMDTGTKFVHLVANSADIERLTFNLTDLMKSFRGFPSSPNRGWALSVSPNVMYRFFSSIAAQMSNSRHRVFSTMEEAIAFLQSVDEALPPIPLHVKQGEN